MIDELAGEGWLDRLERESGEPRNTFLLRQSIKQHAGCMQVLYEFRHKGISYAALHESLEPHYAGILEIYVSLIKAKRLAEENEHEARIKKIELELKKTRKR